MLRLTRTQWAGEVTLNLVALVTSPSGPTTVIGPLFAPAGTKAVILVPEEFTLNWVGVPRNSTSVDPFKDRP
jgi:hypothetical protein